MYFSRVRLNPTRPHTRRLLTSPQALHATVMGSHPPEGDSLTGEGRVLWRLDRLSRHDLQLYVVSPVRPDFTGMLEQAGWPTDPTWDSADYDKFLARLTTGQHWRFRLTANPIRSLKKPHEDDRSRGHVTPHVTAQQQQDWLMSRSDGWGFAIPDNTLGAHETTVSERHTARFGRNSAKLGGHNRQDRVAISRVTYEGILEVKKADALRYALVSGMGRAKAYGCGLMTLARLT